MQSLSLHITFIHTQTSQYQTWLTNSSFRPCQVYHLILSPLPFTQKHVQFLLLLAFLTGNTRLPWPVIGSRVDCEYIRNCIRVQQPSLYSVSRTIGFQDISFINTEGIEAALLGFTHSVLELKNDGRTERAGE